MNYTFLVYGANSNNNGTSSSSRAFLKHILGENIQPALSLQTDYSLNFLQPLVQSALKAGACGEYIPNYLERHANEKQAKSTLRFEAYEKAQPVIRVVTAPTAAAGAPTQQFNIKSAGGANNNTAGGQNPEQQQQQQAPAQPEGKLTLKLGGAKGTWGPKGFNNPNALKPETQQQQQQQAPQQLGVAHVDTTSNITTTTNVY
eukprot:UN04564